MWLTYPLNYRKHLKTVINSFGLTQLTTEHTRITVSLQTFTDQIIRCRPDSELHSVQFQNFKTEHKPTIFNVKSTPKATILVETVNG